MYFFRQLFYYIYTVSVIVFIPLELTASPTEQPPSAFEICMDQPQCSFTGTSKKWPVDGFVARTIKFSYQMFDIQLPCKLDRVSVGWGDSPPYAVWLKGKRLSFGISEVPDEKTSTDYPAILREKSQSDWIPTDIFKIIFNEHKSIDKEPVNAYEKYLWRTAFFYKALVYKSPAFAYVYYHGPWSVYMASIGTQSENRLTVVTHDKYPSHYLTIRDDGVELDLLEKILATIKLNNYSEEIE